MREQVCFLILGYALMGAGMAQLLHRTLFLQGPAGRLEALLWDSPASEGAPPLAALVCHPHPLFGGTIHNKVVYQAAKSLHRFGLPVLRFNFRGAGLSEGAHDRGQGEQDDARAALDFLAAEYPGARLLVGGFSFGAWVGLRVGCGDTRVAELIGIGLPAGNLSPSELACLETSVKPALLVSGERDPYAPREKMMAMVERFSLQTRSHTQVSFIPRADHFFRDHLPELDAVIGAWLVKHHPDLRARESK